MHFLFTKDGNDAMNKKPLLLLEPRKYPRAPRQERAEAEKRNSFTVSPLEFRRQGEKQKNDKRNQTGMHEIKRLFTTLNCMSGMKEHARMTEGYVFPQSTAGR